MHLAQMYIHLNGPPPIPPPSHTAFATGESLNLSVSPLAAAKRSEVHCLLVEGQPRTSRSGQAIPIRSRHSHGAATIKPVQPLPQRKQTPSQIIASRRPTRQHGTKFEPRTHWRYEVSSDHRFVALPSEGRHHRRPRSKSPLGCTNSTSSWPGSSSPLLLTTGVDENTDCDGATAGRSWRAPPSTTLPRCSIPLLSFLFSLPQPWAIRAAFESAFPSPALPSTPSLSATLWVGRPRVGRGRSSAESSRPAKDKVMLKICHDG